MRRSMMWLRVSFAGRTADSRAGSRTLVARQATSDVGQVDGFATLSMTSGRRQRPAGNTEPRAGRKATDAVREMVLGRDLR
jgi:hypothetical protein